MREIEYVKPVSMDGQTGNPPPAPSPTPTPTPPPKDDEPIGGG